MPLSIKNSSAWKTVRGLYVKDGGAWKTVQVGFIKNNGTWKQFFVNLITVNVSSQNNINLRTLYTNQTGEAPTSYTKAQFNINGNIGSTSSGIPSLVTDTWPAGSEVTISVTNGVYVAGAGGGACTAGGAAISLGSNVSIVNNGIIAGGGGGGGSVAVSGRGDAQGGTGAGLVNGQLYNATAGGYWRYGSSNDYQDGAGGHGGALGTAGGPRGGNANPIFGYECGGGAGGVSIQSNGYIATITGSGSRIN